MFLTKTHLSPLPSPSSNYIQHNISSLLQVIDIQSILSRHPHRLSLPCLSIFSTGRKHLLHLITSSSEVDGLTRLTSERADRLLVLPFALFILFNSVLRVFMSKSVHSVFETGYRLNASEWELEIKDVNFYHKPGKVYIFEGCNGCTCGVGGLECGTII